VFPNGAAPFYRAGASGQQSSTTTEVNTASVEVLIQTDGHVSLRFMAFNLRLSCGALQHVMVDVLHCGKVCARWLPSGLRRPQSDKNDDLSQYPASYPEKGNNCLRFVFTGDETCIHHFIPTSR
jgi:hypothetical protein